MEDVKTETETIKVAWIDEVNHVVSFHEIPDSRCYTAPETEFWGAYPGDRQNGICHSIERRSINELQ